QNDAHFAIVGELGSKRKAPLRSSAHFPVYPDFNFENCPQIDVLVIPGGYGSLLAVRNFRIIEFLKQQAISAKYVVSVCTGSSLLAVAGLLDGKRATTNKAWFEQQTWYSEKTEWIWNARWVHEEGSNIITASGVSAGQDMGIYLAGLLFGEQVHKSLCMSLQYSMPLTQSDDPFAKILNRDWTLWKKFGFKMMEFFACYFVYTEIHRPISESKKLGKVVTLLGDGWDALDLAGVLEAACALHSSYKMQLVSLNEEHLIVKGGDSQSKFLHQFINVECDVLMDWVGDGAKSGTLWGNLPVSIIFVPSLPSSQAELACRLVKRLQYLLEMGKIGRILTCGRTILRQAENELKLNLQPFSLAEAVDKVGSWGKFSEQWIHAETGISGIPAFLTFVQEIAGSDVVIRGGQGMEIDPRLMPVGIELK
ncbi:hypothetical protein HK100_000408, partial [Physocladia obscura]